MAILLLDPRGYVFFAVLWRRFAVLFGREWKPGGSRVGQVRVFVSVYGGLVTAK